MFKELVRPYYISISDEAEFSAIHHKRIFDLISYIQNRIPQCIISIDGLSRATFFIKNISDNLDDLISFSIYESRPFLFLVKSTNKKALLDLFPQKSSFIINTLMNEIVESFNNNPIFYNFFKPLNKFEIDFEDLVIDDKNYYYLFDIPFHRKVIDDSYLKNETGTELIPFHFSYSAHVGLFKDGKIDYCHKFDFADIRIWINANESVIYFINKDEHKKIYVDQLEFMSVFDKNNLTQILEKYLCKKMNNFMNGENTFELTDNLDDFMNNIISFQMAYS